MSSCGRWAQVVKSDRFYRWAQSKRYQSGMCDGVRVSLHGTQLTVGCHFSSVQWQYLFIQCNSSGWKTGMDPFEFSFPQESHPVAIGLCSEIEDSSRVDDLNCKAPSFYFEFSSILQMAFVHWSAFQKEHIVDISWSVFHLTIQATF